ncbi:subtilisin-like serine protease [Dissophora globulifera]|uniref:Subtilisin-like serine protease n=1 Tax=Dissophora globulifera TaxID=979702 RepID=A0A9P6RTX6_9FUNG|nr:subtilisin-like serine protease [Dissophora globulifera]
MKFTILLVACIALAQAAPLLPSATNGKPIPDSYIVILKTGNTADSFKPTFNSIAQRQNGRGGVKSEIHREYTAIPGFHASFNKAALKEIQAAPEVAYVEQDAVVTILGQENNPPSWGLTRVSEKDLDLSQPYLYNDAAGSGVTAYIVDTGVFAGHSQFGGRATLAANFIKGSANTDENGHGTHVSGTIGGSTYGVAKKVKIVGVKVLDASGSGSTSGVVAGMDWVAQHATPGKSVVNMSLGGGKSQAINDAAGRLYNANIPLIVAAGNSADDACNGSPSGAPNTFAVGASDNTDAPADFTSFGSCVSIFGPGVDITSSWIGSSSASNTISGTSMATPHVVGVAALYLSEGGISTAQALFDKLSSTATLNAIQGELNGSPNALVYNGGAN